MYIYKVVMLAICKKRSQSGRVKAVWVPKSEVLEVQEQVVVQEVKFKKAKVWVPKSEVLEVQKGKKVVQKGKKVVQKGKKVVQVKKVVQKVEQVEQIQVGLEKKKEKAYVQKLSSEQWWKYQAKLDILEAKREDVELDFVVDCEDLDQEYWSNKKLLDAEISTIISLRIELVELSKEILEDYILEYQCKLCELERRPSATSSSPDPLIPKLKSAIREEIEHLEHVEQKCRDLTRDREQLIEEARIDELEYQEKFLDLLQKRNLKAKPIDEEIERLERNRRLCVVLEC